MRIETNTNAPSVFNAAYERFYGMASKSAERLSSGTQFTKAADGPSALGRSELFKSIMSNTWDATMNMENAISALDASSTGYLEIRELVQRMRELSVNAYNDVLTNHERSNLQKELTQVRGAINDIVGTVKFNNTRVLSSTQSLSIQAGPSAGQTMTMNFYAADTATLNIDGVDISTTAGASSAMSQLDNAITTLDTYIQSTGSQRGRFANAISASKDALAELYLANGKNTDVDLSKENITLMRGTIGIRQNASLARTYESFTKGIVASMLNVSPMKNTQFKPSPVNISAPAAPSARQVMNAPSDLFALSTAMTLEIIV